MTPREQAALAVAHAEAALLDARKALREAVKAEIAAMPPAPDAETLQGARDVVCAILGESRETMGDGFAWDLDGACVSVHRGIDYPMELFVTHSDTHEMTSWILRGRVTADAALRHALTWLADRDVFVEVTR